MLSKSKLAVAFALVLGTASAALAKGHSAHPNPQVFVDPQDPAGPQVPGIFESHDEMPGRTANPQVFVDPQDPAAPRVPGMFGGSRLH